MKVKELREWLQYMNDDCEIVKFILPDGRV